MPWKKLRIFKNYYSKCNVYLYKFNTDMLLRKCEIFLTLIRFYKVENIK